MTLDKLVVVVEASTAKLRAGLRSAQRLSVTAARRMSRSFESFRTSVRNATESLFSLRGAITAAITGGVVSQIAEMSDTWQNMAARISLVTDSTDEARTTMQRLFRVAQNAGASFESVAEIFARVGRSRKDLNASTDQLVRFADILVKMGVVAGTSTQELNAALIQLSQGLASGTLRGDELRSVMEQMPPVIDAIAKSMGITRGQVREFAAEGKITAKTVLNAVLEMGDEIDRQFSRIPVTIGRATRRVLNSLMRAVGTLLGGKGGVSEQVSQFIARLATRIDDTIPKLRELGQTREVVAGLAALGTSVDAVILVLKGLGDVSVSVFDLLKTIGRGIGGIAAAVVAAARGEFSQAATIIRETVTDAFNGVQDAADRLHQSLVTDTADAIESVADRWQHFSEVSSGAAQSMEEVVVTGNRVADTMNRVAAPLDDATKKLNKWIDAQRGALEVLKLRIRGDNEQAAILETVNRLQRSMGRTLTKEELRNVEAFARKRQELERVRAAVEAAAGPERQLKEEVAGLYEALQRGDITFDQFDIALEKAREQFDSFIKESEKTKDVKTGFEDLKRAVEGWSQSFADALLSGEGGFKGFVRSITRELGRLTLTKAFDPFFKAAGSILEGAFSRGSTNGSKGDFFSGGIFGAIKGLFGGLFGGARAGGGPVSPGRAFLVGERGPELFVPKTSGTVVPGTGGVVVNITESDGARVADIQQRRGPSGETIIDMTVLGALSRLSQQGALDPIMSRAFGLRRAARV